MLLTPTSVTVNKYQKTHSEKDYALIAGIPIDKLDYNHAVHRIDCLIKKGRENNTSHYVATVNVDFLVKAIAIFKSNKIQNELLHTLRSSDLVTADGAPIIWLSKLVGTNLHERVTGADLLPKIAQLCCTRNYSMFFLGGDAVSAKQATNKLIKDNPELRIVGALSPYVAIEGKDLETSFTEDQVLVEQINNSGADVLALALGNPKQEIWFQRNRHKLNIPVTIGVGGTLNFISGAVKRAPKWMQNSGLEWVYRLLQEPNRLWKRYAVGSLKLGLLSIPIILNRIIQANFTDHTQGEIKTQIYHSNNTSQIWRFSFKGNITNNTIKSAWTNYLSIQPQNDIHFIFDFSSTTNIENDALANLTRLWSKMQIDKSRWAACSINLKLRFILRLNHLTSNMQSHFVKDFCAVLLAKKGSEGEACCWINGSRINLIGVLDAKWCNLDPLFIDKKDDIPRTRIIDVSGVEQMDNAAVCYVLHACATHNYTIQNDKGGFLPAEHV